MFLPVGDAPNPRFTPWLTWGLIAVNVAIYLALLPQAFQRADLERPEAREYLRTVAEEHSLGVPELRRVAAGLTRYDLTVFEHGFRPAQPGAADVLTSMFLHGGLVHLLGNMLFLWIFGDNVEHRIGRLGFLAAYLGTGAAAVLGDALIRAGSGLPSVGASGAISGVLGAYFLWFPYNRVRTWVFLFPILMDVVEIPARWVLGVYLVVQNLLPLLLSGGRGSGVSYGAHVGGFVAGFAVAFLLERLRLERPEEGVRRAAAQAPGSAATRGGGLGPDAGRSAGASFSAAVAAGRLEEAASILFEAPSALVRQELDPDDLLTLGRGLEERGLGHAALAAYDRLAREHRRSSRVAAAHLGAARVMLRDLDMPTSAYQHVRAALASAPGLEEQAEARLLLAAIAERSESLPRVPYR